MLHRHRKNVSGFTLVELAIVLGVAGVLFGGLWRLMSSGNGQMRDQATANQQAQLINAVSTYLQSPGVLSSTTGGGQGFLSAVAASSTASLTLPTSAAPAGSGGCPAAIPANPGLCNFLPPGFNVATTNPYGQTFSISVLKDATPAGTAPQSYSFMVLTAGGDTIPDTSGGRIGAMIGGDGGFVYTANVCGTPASNACGAYGAWSTTIATYFAAAATSGHIASRTYYTPLQNVSDKWLARVLMPGDTPATPLYNTMATPFFLGGQIAYLGSNSGVATGGGTIAMQAGTINMQAGAINAQAGTIALGTAGQITGGTTATASGSITLAGNMNGAGYNLIFLNGGCSTVATGGALTQSATCHPVAQINGDLNIIGLMQAYSAYSAIFTYNSSDARLKNNIQPLGNPLADIMKLKPVSFIYKANGKKSMGVIAQDLEKVYPQLVEQAPSGFKAVAYDGLIAPLIGSVQELKKENDDLRAQIHDQSVRQEKMERDMEALRRK